MSDPFKSFRCCTGFSSPPCDDGESAGGEVRSDPLVQNAADFLPNGEHDQPRDAPAREAPCLNGQPDARPGAHPLRRGG